MQSNGYISEEELKVKKNKLVVMERESIHSINAEYFREEVRKILYNKYNAFPGWQDVAHRGGRWGF